MNWSKTQIVAFKNEFKKRRFIESFLINPHPTSLTKRVQIFFQTSTKRRLAIIDLIRDCMFLIRFDSTYSLFLTAVILFYSYSSSVIYCAFRNVVVSVITTSSYHARSVNFTALLLESPWWTPLIVGWNVGVVFKGLQQLSKDFYYCYPVGWLCNTKSQVLYETYVTYRLILIHSTCSSSLQSQL